MTTVGKGSRRRASPFLLSSPLVTGQLWVELKEHPNSYPERAYPQESDTLAFPPVASSLIPSIDPESLIRRSSSIPPHTFGVISPRPNDLAELIAKISGVANLTCGDSRARIPHETNDRRKTPSSYPRFLRDDNEHLHRLHRRDRFTRSERRQRHRLHGHALYPNGSRSVDADLRVWRGYLVRGTPFLFLFSKQVSI